LRLKNVNRERSVGKGVSQSSAETATDRHGRTPLLTIPRETEDSAAFKARLSVLINEEKTHIYVDTSFLMWMTKIGSQSRAELIGWLITNCDGRVHVPIWAAHEYLKHHVAGTIVTELSEKADEIAALVGRTYNYFRPFMDEAYGDGAEDPAAIRAATRSALNGLERLGATSRQWHKTYQKHASDVIAFINATSVETTSLYGYFKDLPAMGTGRFIGSIPPGFQDRRKGASSKDKGQDETAPAESNRYGDLVFWKELLDHAKTIEARAIIILTNDRKNDWHLGRSLSIQIDPSLLALKKTWKPVPRAHPMLIMEAKVSAGVEQVELLDSPYLAALLRDLVEDDVRAFADVAIIPDGPEPKKESDFRAKLAEERLEAIGAKLSSDAAERGYLFADGPEVAVSPATMRRALLESRQTVGDLAAALLDEWRASVDVRRPFVEILTPEKLHGFDQKELVRLARELHDRVLREDAGYEEALVDLVSLLEVLPSNTASCLYLGFIASMYLIRETNLSRLPPRSPCAQQLFERQPMDYAAIAIGAVSKRIGDNDFRPVYVPTSDRSSVNVVMDTETNSAELDELRSLRIDDVELLTAAQADDALRLATLFDATVPVDGDAIVRKACELFAVPFEQVERSDAFKLRYAVSNTIGFKRPVDVSIPKEKSLGH
jgi:PIN like domain